MLLSFYYTVEIGSRIKTPKSYPKLSNFKRVWLQFDTLTGGPGSAILSTERRYMFKLFHKIILAGLVISAVVAASDLRNPQPVRSTYAADTQSKSIELDTLWKKPVQPISSIAVSPDGKFSITIGPADLVTCRDANGRIIWQVEVDHATDAVISAGGTMAMVYSAMNPAEEYVTFISPDGSVRWRHKVSGSVWCGTVAEQEPLFAVGTGERWVYVYSVDEDRKRYARWRLPGVVTSLAFLPDGERIAYGTWQESSLGISQIDGTGVWQQPGDPDKLYSVSVTGAGRHLLAVGTPNRRLPVAVASLYTVENSLVWTLSLDGLDVTARVSHLGYTTAFSYKKLITQKDKQVAARYVSLVGRRGTEAWEKGGLFFQPQLAAITRDGLLVHDDRSLYGLDLTGKVSSMLKLPATVRLCRTDSAGSRAVIYCGDGNLYCVSVKAK